MNRTATLFAVVVCAVPAAHAQFGGVVFDPTQAAHVVQQIAQAEKLYTTTIQTTQNVINAYNLAKRMAESPQSLYSSYGSGLPSWVPIIPTNDTYGNTGSWITEVNHATGAVTSAISGASVARVAKLTGYDQLSPQGQRAVAAKGATVDLGDSVSATNMQAIGTIRSAQTARQNEMAQLEAASHSSDPTQQTEMATLQRINQALLLLLRTQQDQSQLAQGQTLQGMVAEKQQMDDQKLLFEAAQGYENNYRGHVSTNVDTVRQAFQY